MPIGKETISESKKNAQYNPGESCNPQRNQIPFSKWSEDPAKKIKRNQCDVKEEKEDIKNLIQTDHWHTWVRSSSQCKDNGPLFVVTNIIG